MATTTTANLRHLVQVQTPGNTEDELGQRIDGTWATLCSVWADIRHPSGLEQTRGDAVISRVRASIRVRLRNDITPAMRVVHAGTVYEVKAVLPELQSRAYMDLVCEAVA